MSPQTDPVKQPVVQNVRLERTFQRFSISQRWEHAVLLLSILVLLLTGLPQKYRSATWSQQIINTPERLELIRQVHHIAALALAVEVLYHLCKAVTLMAKRRLSSDMFPTWQDVKDAGQMLKYLLFLSKKKPAFRKFNFEQKFTYWFIFFSVGIMGISGLILWFPLVVTRVFPGGIVPAAKLAHSTEAVVTAIFILIWHFYHVHLERLNLSIFTGRLSEGEMQNYHSLHYERLTGEKIEPTQTGGSR